MKKACYLLFASLFFGGIMPGQELTFTEAFHRVTQVNDWLDTDAKLYIATDVGVYVYDKATNSLEDHWTVASAGLPSNRVEAIGLHPQTQSLYIGTYDIGMGLQAADGSWASMPYPDAWLDAAFNPFRTYCFAFDAYDRLWVGTSEGVARWDGSEWAWVDIAEPAFFTAWEMERRPDGELLIGGNVLLQTDLAADTLLMLNPMGDFSFPDLFAYGSAHLCRQDNGVIWWATDVGGLGRYQDGEWTVFDAADENAPDWLWQMEDIVPWGEDQSLMVGRFAPFFHAFSEADSGFTDVDLPFAPANPIGVHYQDGQWYGLSNDTLVGTGMAPLGLSNWPWDNTPYNLQQDAEGRLWQAVPGGLATLDRSLQWNFVVNDQPVSFFRYHFSPDGSVWLLGVGILYHFEGESLLAAYHPGEAGWPGSFVRSLVEDEAGNLWAWSFVDGLFVLQGGQWESVPFPVEDGNVLAMAAHPGQGLWMTTYEDGDVKLYHQLPTGATEVNLPSGWASSDYLNLAHDLQRGETWMIGLHQLARYNGEAWESIDLPANWVTDDYARHLGFHASGIYLSAEFQFAILHDGEWSVWNTAELPMDTDPIAAIGLDEQGVLWVIHRGERVAETFQTTLLTTSLDESPLDVTLELEVYPNPVRGERVSISVPDHQAGQVLLYDQGGQLLRRWLVPAGVGSRVDLSLSGLSAGTYTCQFRSADGSVLGIARLLVLAR